MFICLFVCLFVCLIVYFKFVSFFLFCLQITDEHLEWYADAKVRSRENIHHQPGGGHVKVISLPRPRGGGGGGGGGRVCAALHQGCSGV